ncbi:family 43 glycosylhydrolase [Stieleria varia]|uniref:Xylosidase/arabinosidase n=1 Tax=Stieleria varia TaxID=2528005 RepID=A0A5C6A2Q4_9BACT|nr:family 43 glycosylhydrolase [Stieleria varia]TWT93819.1 Xylosidase/arabinosidase [Stieleria varia]
MIRQTSILFFVLVVLTTTTGRASIAAAEPDASRAVILSDSLQQLAADRWSTAGGQWRPGASGITVTGGQGPRLMLTNQSLQDFELEVEVRTNAQAGVVFRVADSQPGVDAYRGYYVGVDAGAESILWGASEGAWRQIASRPGPIDSSHWYRLRLIVRDANVKVFVDNVAAGSTEFPIIDGIDQANRVGQVGLRSLGRESRFRNLVIRELEPLNAAPTYTNPLKPGIADPTVLLHEGIYYLYCTHSHDHPDMRRGIRLFTSPNLVNWDDRGYIVRNEDSWGDSRFWAPDIIERNGKFYLYYAADTRICVAVADSPAGPFKQIGDRPMSPDSIRIDAHVFQDDDGQCYFYYVHFNRGNEIWGGKLNDDMITVDESSLKRLIQPDQGWERHQAPIAEGPEVLKHNGVYYLTYSGSHFESPEYAVGYATSDSPLGPWKKYQYNPIMKSTAYAHGTAHHCITESLDGKEKWIVYHRHFSLTETEPRQLSIDRLRFVPQDDGPDVLAVWGPTSSPQPVP